MAIPEGNNIILTPRFRIATHLSGEGFLFISILKKNRNKIFPKKHVCSAASAHL